jgi:hypothetical protein
MMLMIMWCLNNDHMTLHNIPEENNYYTTPCNIPEEHRSQNINDLIHNLNVLQHINLRRTITQQSNVAYIRENKCSSV